jgi:hypothetical protein
LFDAAVRVFDAAFGHHHPLSRRGDLSDEVLTWLNGAAYVNICRGGVNDIFNLENRVWVQLQIKLGAFVIFRRDVLAGVVGHESGRDQRDTTQTMPEPV